MAIGRKNLRFLKKQIGENSIFTKSKLAAPMKNIIIYILGSILLVGGIYTLYTSGGILFDAPRMRAKAGNYIQMTIVANFICSFIYIVCGYLFFIKSKLSTTLLFFATIIMFIGYIGMLFHIQAGKPFDISTIQEMLIRTTGTMIYAAIAWYIFTRIRLEYPAGYNAKTFKQFIKEREMKKAKYPF